MEIRKFEFVAKTQFLYLFIVEPYYVLLITIKPGNHTKVYSSSNKHHKRIGGGGGVVIIQYTPLGLDEATKMMGLYSCA